MPTIILIDNSLSLLHPLSFSNNSHLQHNVNFTNNIFPITRKELIQKGRIIYFLELLEKEDLDFISLITFSSQCEIVVPFTKDYSLLKNSINSIKLKDKSKTCFSKGIEFSLKYIDEQWKNNESYYQLILITDGKDNNYNNNYNLHLLEKHIFIHIIVLGTISEIEIDQLKQITQKTNGSFHLIAIPQQIHLFNQSFEKIIQNYYNKFIGSLVCGHITSTISLYPNPNLTINQHSILPLIEEDILFISKFWFPNIISIVGFIPNKKISCPPSISQHFIIPILSSNNSSCPSELNLINNSNNNQIFLPLILNECLKNNKMTAIVILKKNWFGMISSLIQKDKSNLMLSICLPSYSIPWIGDLTNLFTFNSKNSSENYSHLTNIYPKSYSIQDEDDNYLITNLSEDIFQIHFQKIFRYCKNIPQKQLSLYNEIELLRNLSIIFYLPSLLETLKKILKEELNTYKEHSDGFIILKDIIEKLELSPQVEINKNISTSKISMNVNNLLN